MKKVIGLTGPIGSGKSSVSEILRTNGAQIIDADIIARKVVQKGTVLLKKLQNTFGSNILDHEGNLNRRALGKLVFEKDEKREMLNELLHPAIIEEVEKYLEVFFNESKAIVAVIDAALLIETGLDQKVDQVWYVDAEVDLRIKRIIQRDKIAFKEAMNRVKAQPGQVENKKKSHIIIDNNGDRHGLSKQVEHYFNQFMEENQ
ncbi:dephospho-CoA kinase [Tindallia californiensis]|uniref:Dephospho-CoA kinase n=1 Tax=Tindallia californiensis TaxID=159292 RepID=A0A1H3IXU5_9FIRM|nr:dephospho-CoA kinase [Tindallia californiensis]SDY31724.1 dephospho-CoA kinase [Tindallia californiensis]